MLPIFSLSDRGQRVTNTYSLFRGVINNTEQINLVLVLVYDPKNVNADQKLPPENSDLECKKLLMRNRNVVASFKQICLTFFRYIKQVKKKKKKNLVIAKTLII